MMYKSREEILAGIRALDFSMQPYRGFEIHTSALSGRMWVARAAYPFGMGPTICEIPAAKSWSYARACIDEYTGVI